MRNTFAQAAQIHTFTKHCLHITTTNDNIFHTSVLYSSSQSVVRNPTWVPRHFQRLHEVKIVFTICLFHCQSLKNVPQGLPWQPVVKTMLPTAEGTGLTPGQGTKILYAK